MGRINKEWHLASKMPKNPTFEQRVEWHKRHQKNCACRTDLPPDIERAIKTQKSAEPGAQSAVLGRAAVESSYS